MIILSIRTDKPLAEIGLYDDHKLIADHSWQAHRQLAETIHLELKKLIEGSNKSWADLSGIVFYKGPGSFTGLRIGASVANALASSLKIPIAGEQSEEWLQTGIDKLISNHDDQAVSIEYGKPVNITQPRK